MRVAGIREIRTKMASLFGGKEPFLVTKHGKISGLYVPLEDPDRLPADLRSDLVRVLGNHLEEQARRSGLTEEKLEEGFRAHRSSRRRR